MLCHKPKTANVDVTATHFLDEILSFAEFGQPTVVVNGSKTHAYVNEFWTSKQRSGHALHEISYRACFKPQLPEFFVRRLCPVGGTVYDPFMGRGTTVVQAALMGMNSIGSDINPLSSMLCRPRINTPAYTEIMTRLHDINWSSDVLTDDDLLVFFHQNTLSELASLRRYLRARKADGKFDAIDDWIRMVALNRLTGHSSGFLSVYTLPPNQAVSATRQRKINEKRNQIPTYRNVCSSILKKSKSLLRHGGLRAKSTLLTAPSWSCPAIQDSSVDLVVTSPPFLDVVDYASDNWLRSWFAGIDATSVSISKHRRLEDWKGFILKTFYELARVVKTGGFVAFEVGEVRNGTVRLEEEVISAVQGLPFRLVGVLINDQTFTKTANCWGISNNHAGTNTNRIVVMERIK